MNQENKELLLKDLCGRLPYGVKCTTKSSWNGIYTIEGYKDNRFFLDCPVYDKGDDEWMIESVVPYLRPMSSMTEEEKKELKCLFDAKNITNDSICFLEGGTLEEYEAQIPFSFCSKLIDWLNAHHFDYRNLIEKGLAIEVTEKNNPYKE